jgi:hypothetical protein
VWTALALPFVVAAIVAPLVALGASSGSEANAKQLAAQQPLAQAFSRPPNPLYISGGLGDQAIRSIASRGGGGAVAVGFSGPKSSRAATIW